MSTYIGDTAYDGTLERSVALILDHCVIYAGKTEHGRSRFILLDEQKGWDGVTDYIIEAVKRHDPNEKRLKRPLTWDEIHDWMMTAHFENLKKGTT